MNITINKEVLLNCLQRVLGPTTTKQNFPVLSGVFIKTLDGLIKITTTDLDITITTQEKVQVNQSGEFLVPMKRFFSIIKELPDGEITIEKTKNNLLINCGKVEFKITTLNSAEYPQVQEPQKVSLIKLNCQTLEEMIRSTSFCVGLDDTNYVLNGILFEIEKDLIKIVSTDGKRLAFIKRKLPPNQPEIASKISFILPIKTVNEVYRLIKESNDELLLSVEENRVGLDLRNTLLIARPIEGEFPDYSQYIPTKGKDRLTVNRKDMLTSLKRASLLTAPDFQGVKMELKKQGIVISKNTPQLGEVREELDADYTGSNLEIGFNPTYVIDVLRNLNDTEVSFDFFGVDKPAVLRREDYVYLLLPMKM
tara:strand:+ start:244 stop:1341 length:1098 start_codon:yes stop_codon:yes gene_type:complete